MAHHIATSPTNYLSGFQSCLLKKTSDDAPRMSCAESEQVDKIIQTKMGLSKVKRILAGFAEYLEDKRERLDRETLDLQSLLTEDLNSSIFFLEMDSNTEDLGMSFMPFVEIEGVEKEDIPRPLQKYFERLYQYIKDAPEEGEKQKRIQSCLQRLTDDLIERVKKQCKTSISNVTEFKQAEEAWAQENALQAFLKKMKDIEEGKSRYLTYRLPGGRGEHSLLNLSFGNLDVMKIQLLRIAINQDPLALEDQIKELKDAVKKDTFIRIEQISEEIKKVLDLIHKNLPALDLEQFFIAG